MLLCLDVAIVLLIIALLEEFQGRWGGLDAI